MKKKPSLVSIVLLLTFANLLILVIRNIIVGNDIDSFLRSNLFIGSFPVIAIATCLYHFNHKVSPVITGTCINMAAKAWTIKRYALSNFY